MQKMKYGIKIIVILLTICILAEAFRENHVAEAAEGRYGIWCPICGKWQDHFNGIVEGENLLVTEYADGSMSCGYAKITVECKDCGKKLIYLKRVDSYSIQNSGTEDEYGIYWEDYEICRYESTVQFPSMEVHADEDTSLDDESSYKILSDNNVFASSSYWATEDEFKEARDVVTNLFISLANCLTKTKQSFSDTNIVSKYMITDKEFTWADWYDSGTRIDPSGNKDSMLIWYLKQFGLTALRQNSYSITFYANGGLGAMEKVSTSGSYTLPANTFHRDGYRFLGWAKEADGAIVFADMGNVVVSEDMVLYAVWQKEKEPPKLEVKGDVQIKLYRNGNLTDGTVKAGDRVELILEEKQGREYASAAVSTTLSDLNWDSMSKVLSFTMPDADTTIQIYYRELQSLEISLNAFFYQTYQKAPYWNGENFDLDCSTPIVVQKDMLDVTAVFYHTGTGKTEKRNVTEFSFIGSNQIQNLGENVITIEADVLGDGYVLTGQCVLKADSSSLAELMEETDSQTYTELKKFVEGLTEELDNCESMIEDLSSKWTISEEERKKCEEMLEAAIAESERLSKELEFSNGKVAEMTQELEKMVEKMKLLQELMQDITGSTEIDESTVEELKRRFQELEEEKDSLLGKITQLEKEKEELLKKLEKMEGEKAELTEKVSGLESEKEELNGKLSGLESEKEELSGKLSGLESEKEELSGKLSGLESEKEELSGKLSGLESEKEELNGKLSGLELESGNMAEKYAKLLQENDRLLLWKDRMKETNEELSDQLEHNLKEQSLLLKDYELLKNNYEMLSERYQKLEKEYQTKVSEKEQSLAQMKQDQEVLAGQITALEQEKQSLQAEKVTLQQEKQQLSSTIQILRAENQEWREQIHNLTEQKKEEVTLENADVGQYEKEESLQQEVTEQTTILLDHPDKKWESETEVRDSVAEKQTREEIIMKSDTEQADVKRNDTEKTDVESAEAKESEIAVASKSRSMLMGILIVVVAMLLGGAVLYLALGQGEKTEQCTCD